MARADGRHLRSRPALNRAALLIAAVALAGCQLGPTEPEGAQAARTVGTGAQMVERDVERPDVFDTAEPGLWDGRPSLGGIWVAHPDVTDPERAVIRNVETGASVTGALFRREREQPGPRFQISSEAANALGILPGAPTPIRVTAVRMEQVEIAPPVADADSGEDAAEALATPVATGPAALGGLRGFFQRFWPAAEPAAGAEAPAAEPASRAATRSDARWR